MEYVTMWFFLGIYICIYYHLLKNEQSKVKHARELIQKIADKLGVE